MNSDYMTRDIIEESKGDRERAEDERVASDNRGLAVAAAFTVAACAAGIAEVLTDSFAAMGVALPLAQAGGYLMTPGSYRAMADQPLSRSDRRGLALSAAFTVAAYALGTAGLLMRDTALLAAAIPVAGAAGYLMTPKSARDKVRIEPDQTY